MKPLNFCKPYFFHLIVWLTLAGYTHQTYAQTLPVSKDSIPAIQKDTISISKDSITIPKDSITIQKPKTVANDSIPSSVSKKKITPKKAEKKKDTIPFVRNGNFLTKFSRPTINLKQGQIISNVLKVVNLGNKTVRFTTDLLYPASWTRIDNPDRVFTAQPKDTVIVPVIISPSKLVNGNTEIIINAFLVSTDQQQLANNYFSLKTKKKVSWKINLSNNQNVYFKNDETGKRLDFSVENTGNYKQDIFINYSVPKKDLILSDTLARPIREPNTTFSLEAGQTKDFNYMVVVKDQDKRNRKRISLNSYSPARRTHKMKRSLIINSSEPKSTGTSNLHKRTKINFIKLPNEIQTNPYGYPFIPITAELSAQNILSDRSFMSLNLRGFKQLTPRSNIIYSTQLNYSNSFFTNNVFKNAPWYIGYFDDKKTIEFGLVSGNLVGVSSAGKGVNGSYIFDEKHAAGAFFVSSEGLFDFSGNTTIGGWYRYIHDNNFDITVRAGRKNNKVAKRNSTVISLHPNFNLLSKHFISLTGAMISNDDQARNQNTSGFLFGSSYASAFLKNKLRTNFSFRFNDKNFNFGNYEQLTINNRVGYEFNEKWTGFISSNYQLLQTYAAAKPIFRQESFYSNAVFSTQTPTGSYQPGVYYEYRNFPNNRFHNRGLTFRYSKYNFLNNFVMSFYTRAGYTRPTLSSLAPKDYFNIEVSTLARYRTWSITARYNLGAFSSLTSQRNVNDLITPQSIRISVQNQHLFSNRHFALESNMIYSYNNIFKNHTLGLFPQGYYFTDSGWRFGVSANYTFSTSDFSSVFDNTSTTNNPNLRNLGPTTTNNFNLNFSIRKDFGIPIPFVEKTAATTTFLSFLDVNGNGIKEKEETSLQNVVVRLRKDEVLTDYDGKATMKNVLRGKYKFDAFSLENLNGWFPNVKDSIHIQEDGIAHIPFVRGVKVYGDVILDRQKIAVADDKSVDLSRIKVTAIKGDKIYNTLTNKDGRFEFYLPFGDYTITMDEGILSSRFRITRNNIPIRLKNSQDGVYVSFYIVEKRRKVIFKDFSKKKN